VVAICQYSAKFYLNYLATWPDYSCVAEGPHGGNIIGYGKKHNLPSSFRHQRTLMSSLGLQPSASTNHPNRIPNITAT
jgi:hypothetical protein